jgi:mono/diheme cytochrome c family protein
MRPKFSNKRIANAFVVSLFAFTLLNINPALAQADAVPTDPAVIAAGESLFNNNCKVCHNINGRLIGPPLANIYDRRELPWIYSFVQNSQKLIKSGDEYAVNLYNEYNQIAMTAFDTFSDDEVLSIVAYIKDQVDNPPVEEAVTTTTDAGQADAEVAGPAKYLRAIIIGSLVILVILGIVMVFIITELTRYLKLKQDLDEAGADLVAQPGLLAFMRNKAFIGVVAAVLTAVVAKGSIDALYNIGIQQGYAPAQPIAYSHKVHAGDYQIDCNYCHTGVTKSKNANIPSPSICMNCHNSITKGTNTGTAEIEKIYAAIENNQPIEWVRVHNLPDHAYFNHSQHVAVGKVECQTCHGPIEEMEVVRQHSLLTMGWCISCHRDTDLNTRGNGYYDKLVELHNAEYGDKASFTVEDNGGLECAKCHY